VDRYGIDSHKLALHPERVVQWMGSGLDWDKAKSIYPIYVEVSPAGACNHRCTFCAVDYIGYQTRFLDKELLKDRLAEMASLGVRSVMFAGEGEPLLHKGMAEVTTQAKKAGLDLSITTNAVALTDRFLEEALGSISWIKASINAGRPETYAKVHQTKAEDFERALANMGRAAALKKAKGLKVVLGAQMVLLPENQGEAVALARRAKEAGLDYAVIKPYSQHKLSQTRRYEDLHYQGLMKLADELEAFNDDRFHVVFRANAMRKWDDPDRHYTKCHATPHFWAYVMASGDVYGCSAYLLDERFRYGNLNERGFKDIWEGEERRRNWRYVLEELDISECRKNCRMDEVNRYLWSLKNPPEHANFI
jgi:radical SAM protein with 4Fe4S-binding SPASM domain